jgi:hypothetical protein
VQGEDPCITVVRTLTSERGEFALQLQAVGRYGLQVLRIGFRPTVVPPFAVAAGPATSVRIVLNAAAIPLTTVNVRAQDECRVNPDSGLMVARVWDEADRATDVRDHLPTHEALAASAPSVATGHRSDSHFASEESSPRTSGPADALLIYKMNSREGETSGLSRNLHPSITEKAW